MKTDTREYAPNPRITADDYALLAAMEAAAKNAAAE